MTMIMMHDRFMACDSRVTSGSFVVSDTATPHKVTRAVDGSLVGVMGSITYGHRILAWARVSMDMDQFPELKLSPTDDPTDYLFALLRPDGTKYLGDLVGQLHQCDDTEFLAGQQAIAYAFGVFDTLGRLKFPPIPPRMLVTRTMYMVTERCPTVGGQIHVFDLDHPELDP